MAFIIKKVRKTIQIQIYIKKEVQLMTEFKYQKIRKEIELAIDNRIYVDKLPSVRKYAKEHKVSISTVQKAYEQLELNGVIEARPQKGYFIKCCLQGGFSNYGQQYSKVTTSELLERQVLDSINDSDVLPLASTAPSSVVNNESLLSKYHKKSFHSSIYQFDIEDEIQGSEILRQAISQLLFRQGMVCTPGDIVITSGRRESLLVALAATGSIGGCVAVESPTSFYFQSSVKRLCSEVIAIPMQNEYREELKLLKKAHDNYKFNVYLVNPSFNDPTGRLLTDCEKLELLKWSAQARVTLIEYDRSQLNFSGNRPQSLAALCEQVPEAKVISIQDFFDTISLRMNLGFIICKQATDRLLIVKNTITEEPNLNCQNIVNSLIRSGSYEKILEKLSYHLHKNYLATLGILKQELPDKIQFSQINGGPCLWLKLNNASSNELWHHLIKKKVSIAPGDMFCLQDSFKQYFRLTFALPWNTTMAAGIKQVCRSISLLEGSTIKSKPDC